MPKRGSGKEKPKVTGKLRERRHLRPEEARKLIDAAGKRGRYPFRDRVLLRLLYRHGLRASEAVGLRWSAIDLEHGILHVERSKGGKVSTHSLDRDELRDLRKLREQVNSLFVFETERGGPLSVDNRCLWTTPSIPHSPQHRGARTSRRALNKEAFSRPAASANLEQAGQGSAIRRG